MSVFDGHLLDARGRSQPATSVVVVLDPPHLCGSTVPVLPRRCVIGRSDGADLPIPDPGVSRHHAAVWAADGAIWLADLGSSNGTAVNGWPVGRTPVPISVGDLVTLGPVTLAVRPIGGRRVRDGSPNTVGQSGRAATGNGVGQSGRAATRNGVGQSGWVGARNGIGVPGGGGVLDRTGVPNGAAVASEAAVSGGHAVPNAVGVPDRAGSLNGAASYAFSGGQQAGVINNVGRDYQVAHHNRYDIDLNPLPRSRAGRMLILAGVTLKFTGVAMFGYFVVRFIQVIFNAIREQSDTVDWSPLPAPGPWAGGGLVLTLIGTVLWIYGVVLALSARRRNT